MRYFFFPRLFTAVSSILREKEVHDNKYTQTTFSNSGSNEIAITKGRELVAHTSFCYVNRKSEVIITDLFVNEAYRDTAFMDVLMAEIEHFAAQQQARTIKVFCGNEPMCADGQIPLEDEVEWYQSHGFAVQGYVYDKGASFASMRPLASDIIPSNLS